MSKISRGQGTHYLSVYQIWGIYRTFEAMNADKWLEVGQSVQIGMKLELDMRHRLLDIYTKSQTDISKHVLKKSGKLFAGWELY